MIVHDGRARREVPALWENHNWERPYSYMQSLQEELQEVVSQPIEHDYLFTSIISGFDCKRVLARRSLTRSVDASLDNHQARVLIRSLYQALLREPILFACIITVDVGEWPNGYWIVDHTPRALIRSSRRYAARDVSRLIQGQAWSDGPGLAVVLGIDWDAPRSHGPEHAYANALSTCGRLGHALVIEGLHLGLSARMTPAVHETTAREMFDLPESRDALYFLRLARPHVSVR